MLNYFDSVFKVFKSIMLADDVDDTSKYKKIDIFGIDADTLRQFLVYIDHFLHIDLDSFHGFFLIDLFVRFCGMLDDIVTNTTISIFTKIFCSLTKLLVTFHFVLKRWILGISVSNN